jgi:tetratricopeptide (TPR) repeat protein
MKRILSLLFFALACRLGATAEIELYNAAAISFPTLAVPVGVKAIGMGEAYTSNGGDVYTLHWNPAGLARMTGFELGLAHNEWSSALGLRQEFLAYGQGVGQKSGMGLSINYFSLGSLDKRDSSGALLGQADASALAATLGYASSMLERDRLKLGLTVEFANQSLFGSAMSGIGGSLGLLFDFTRDTAIGLSVNHLGGGTGGFAPPQLLNLGLSTSLLNRNLTLALDGVLPFSADPLIKAGLEMNLSGFFLRGGYRYAMGAKPGDVQSGLTAGVGFKTGVFAVDYAYVPYGELSTTHRVAATISLPGDFFKPKIIGAEATTTTAKTYYEKAVALEKSGDMMKAWAQYQRAEELYPEKMKAKPQQFYVTTLKKIKELDAEIKKGKDSGQSSKLAKEYVSKAEQLIAARRYREAFEPLQMAKKLDAANPAIEKLLKDAKAGFEERLKGFRNEARAADRAGRLPVAVDNYKKLLQIDPGDAEAEAFFASKRKEIESMLKKVHRQGIDLYVAGKVEEAVKVWNNGAQLDYFGAVDFKRDIDKAKKLLDLRGQK